MKGKLRDKINGKDKKGITLVALVVTVVVLLILAGVSIVTLFGENGIITSSQKAKNLTEAGVNKDLAGLEKLEGMLTSWEEVKNEKGQVVKVKKGKIELDIGDYINYDCTKNASGQAITESYTSYAYGKANNDHNGRTSGYSKDQTFKASDYTGKWRVLGVESGELLIMPAINVPLTLEGNTSTTKNFYLGSGDSKTDAEQGKAAYKYGIEELDNISKIYAKGKGASGKARSIKVEDVNNITGYKPEAPAGSADNKYGKNQLYEYDNKVEYTWKGRTAPYYTASNEYTPGTLTSAHNTSYGFTYWDEDSNDWVKSAYTSTAQTSPITTLKSTSYIYYPETLTATNTPTATTGIANISKQRDMLFGNDSSERYWLGSLCVGTFTYYASFELRIVYSGLVNRCALFYSYGGGDIRAYGVRPVVSLSSEVQLEPATNGGGVTSWNIK